jgi:hypothetical protein
MSGSVPGRGGGGRRCWWLSTQTVAWVRIGGRFAGQAMEVFQDGVQVGGVWVAVVEGVVVRRLMASAAARAVGDGCHAAVPPAGQGQGQAAAAEAVVVSVVSGVRAGPRRRGSDGWGAYMLAHGSVAPVESREQAVAAPVHRGRPVWGLEDVGVFSLASVFSAVASANSGRVRWNRWRLVRTHPLVGGSLGWSLPAGRGGGVGRDSSRSEVLSSPGGTVPDWWFCCLSWLSNCT